MDGWSRSESLELFGIIASGLIAIAFFLLQKRLTTKQRLDNRLEIEQKAGNRLYDINHKYHSSKVQLYNVRLLNKKYFSQNKRDVFWGYPFLAAELYSANFDGLEFIIGIEEWNNKKYYKVGVIPYENILGVKPDGDGSFNGMIIYVKPKLLQRDKYSIAYKSYRYYPTKDGGGFSMIKPFRRRLRDDVNNFISEARYHLYYSWRNK